MWSSVSDVAARFQVKEHTVRSWIKNGDIPARFVNKVYGPTKKRATIRVNVDAYEKHIETQGNAKGSR